jgi:hypothetical protein
MSVKMQPAKRSFSGHQRKKQYRVLPAQPQSCRMSSGILPFITLKVYVSVFRAVYVTSVPPGGNPMPKRMKSLALTIFSAVFVSFSMLAIDFDRDAQAGDICIEKLPRPASEGAPGNPARDYMICHSCYFTKEILLWDVRYDRATGRTCWFLRDAYGRDVTDAHVRSSAAPTPTFTLSSLTSWFANFNFMRALASAGPESNSSQTTPVEPPGKHQRDTANMKKMASGVRDSHRSDSEARSEKRGSQASTHRDDQDDERAQFEEFLRWRERRKVIDPMRPSPSMRQ